MEIWVKCINLMDATILAILRVPVLSVFLVGSTMLAMLGLFLLLKDAASGRNSRK